MPVLPLIDLLILIAWTSLIGAGLRPVTHLFLGWFGPRGLASILFGLLILDRLAIDNREPMLTVVVLTVLLSVFAHGITAVPAARAYARFMRARQDRDQLPEHMTAS